MTLGVANVFGEFFSQIDGLLVLGLGSSFDSFEIRQIAVVQVLLCGNGAFVVGVVS